MRRFRSALLLTLLAPIATLPAQEYEVGVGYTRTTIAYDWKDGTGTGSGPRAALGQVGGSVSAPVGFIDVNAPFPIGRKYMVTGNLGVRWPLGADVGEIDFGAGVARLIDDGYVALRLMSVGAVNTSVLGEDWGHPNRGVQLIVRRGDWRADLMRTGHESRTAFAGGDDVRKNSITMAALRYRFVGVRVDRWVDRFTAASGNYDQNALNRISLYVAFDRHVGRRR